MWRRLLTLFLLTTRMKKKSSGSSASKSKTSLTTQKKRYKPNQKIMRWAEEIKKKGLMPTPEEIELQVDFERNQIKDGIERLRKNTKDLENKSYASATVYGHSSIAELLPYLVRHLHETDQRIKERHVGHLLKPIREYILAVDYESSALITLKTIFDQVFSSKPKANLVTNVTTMIGQNLEDECQMRYYEKQYPNLLESIKQNYWHKSIGTKQKVSTTQTLINRKEDVVPWKCWEQHAKVQIGGWLLEAVMTISGWFERIQIVERNKKYAKIVPTEKFMRVQSSVMDMAELFCPLKLPMLIEPKDWHAIHEAGGYYLNEVRRGNPMVRRGKGTLLQGETPVEFLNKIQKTSYKLNTFIADVAEVLYERQIQVGKFIPIIEMPLPPKPVDIADNYDSRKNYRREAAQAYNENAQAYRKACRTRMTLEVMRKFRDKERWYIPYSFDYRGRVYPIPSFLTPQDTDFGKSLLLFSEGSYLHGVDEQWLAFDVATKFGLDKAPMGERIQWAQDNEDLIHAIATDPIGRLSDWEGADEPWQFLASCREYNALLIDCTEQKTHLPVAVDATCSGLQILAGLARDKNTAKLVNVTPSERPQDAYKVIAKSALSDVPPSVKPHMDRKVTKRTVMTVPYNAKPFSNRGYIREALREKGVEVDKEDLTQTVKAVRAAMYREVPGPMKVMDWIEKEVGNAMERGLTHLQWTTPSGFVVHQKLNKRDTKRVRLQLMGECKLSISEMNDQVDVKHHKNATAPNLIHSLDASLLHLATVRWEAPIALIHDSVLARATDMSQLNTVIRETYRHLFAENDYLREFAKQIGAETQPPIVGDLKPENVMASTYFFC